MKDPMFADDAFCGEPMRTIGNLKLTEDVAGRFNAALEHYEIERVSTFLRRCAYVIIRHAEAGDILEDPWSLKTIRGPEQDSVERKSKRKKKKENKGVA